MEFLGKAGNGPMNKRLHFGGDPDHGYGALVEVCTVPVLLVLYLRKSSENQSAFANVKGKKSGIFLTASG